MAFKRDRKQSVSQKTSYSRSAQKPADSSADNQNFYSKQDHIIQPASSSIPKTKDGTQSRALNKYSRKSSPSSYADQFSRNSPQYSVSANRKKHRGKKIALGVVAVLVVALIGVGTAFGLYLNSINNDLSGNKTDEELQSIKDALIPTKNFNEPFYMLLVGSDARAEDGSMGARSDTNVLVWVDPTKNIVTLISIPRDTKIYINGYGTQKFNAAYAFGGTSGAIKAASSLSGVDISHYAEIDFDQLISLVDSVGGIEVNVPELVDDPDAGSIVIQPGLQTLNGEAALVFARSRAYADGDFTRTSNQRLILEALAKKILSKSATDLPAIIQKAAKSISTDLTANDIFSLATQFKNLGKLTLYSAMVPSSTTTIGDASYVVADTYVLENMLKVVEAGGDPNSVLSSSTSS